MSMTESYGHAYLTSYGWSGSGTGLRKGAIDKPIAIPPKKNLSGLGKDRDDAFPFWDHLFTAASKAITIKISSDDEEDSEDPPSHTDPGSAPLRRTTTGIISNRRPVSGTPASASGSTTPNPNPNADTDIDADAFGPLSLLAAAKREAAKRGLYSRFFRGPVLGPEGDACMNTTSPLVPPSSTSTSTSTSTPVPGHVCAQDGITGQKRELQDKAEMKEEQSERKRLKKERRAARAAKKAAKALVRGSAEENKGWPDNIGRKVRKHRDKEACSRESETSPHPKARKHARKSVAGSGGDDLEQAKRWEKELAPTNKLDASRTPACNVDPSSVVPATKKRKWKDTLS